MEALDSMLGIRRREAQMVRKRYFPKYLLYLGPGTLLLPVLVYGIFSSYLPTLSVAAYRGLQILWIASMLALSMYSNKLAYGQSILRVSHSCRLISFFLTIPTLFGMVIFWLGKGDYDSGPEFLVVFTFILMLFIVDQFRTVGFRRFLSYSAPLAYLVIFASAAILVLQPVVSWGGRYHWFDLHPNLGGEILFVCVISLMCTRRNLWCVLAMGVALTVLILMQSRAALIASMGAIILISVYDLYKARISVTKKILTINAVFFVLFVLIAASLLPRMVQTAIQFDLYNAISNEVLLLDSETRGAGSGFSGRTKLMDSGLEQFMKNPLSGSGVGNSQQFGKSLHNGFVIIFAELGMFSILLMLLFSRRIVNIWMQDKFRFSVIICSCFMFYFSARGVNLNVFPFIMWIALLDWSEGSMSGNMNSRKVIASNSLRATYR